MYLWGGDKHENLDHNPGEQTCLYFTGNSYIFILGMLTIQYNFIIFQSWKLAKIDIIFDQVSHCIKV